jgi:hypothetical protein
MGRPAFYEQIRAASDAGFSVFSQLAITNNTRLFAIASGPKRTTSVIALELDTLKVSPGTLNNQNESEAREKDCSCQS